jgi:hypothetical protein
MGLEVHQLFQSLVLEIGDWEGWLLQVQVYGHCRAEHLQDWLCEPAAAAAASTGVFDVLIQYPETEAASETGQPAWFCSPILSSQFNEGGWFGYFI